MADLGRVVLARRYRPSQAASVRMRRPSLTKVVPTEPDCVCRLFAQAAPYVAWAPKSNRAGAAYWAPLADVESQGRLPVPLHLRPGTHPRLAREQGHGRGYQYPHDFPGADVDQQYLPDALVERVYYEPSDQGMETQIGERLARLRALRKASSEG